MALAVDLLIVACLSVCALMLGSRKGLPQLARLAEIAPEELTDEMPALMLGTLSGFLVIALAPLVGSWQISRYGQTPGKSLIGISLRTLSDGRFPSFGRACLREYIKLLILIPCLLPGLSVITPIIVLIITLGMYRTPLLQTFYDRWAQTIVVSPVPSDEPS